MTSDSTGMKQHLIQCFAAVFPSLGDEQIARARQTSMVEWDSLATVTLLALLEDEFGIEIPPEDLHDLDSFEAYSNYLESAQTSLKPRS